MGRRQRTAVAVSGLPGPGVNERRLCLEHGQPDHDLPLDGVLAHLTALSAATDLPVNADFESGFAHAPEDVAANVTRAIATGVAGLSIEDIDTARGTVLYDQAFAVDRIKAARAAIDASGQDVILVARTEGLLADPKALTPAIDKLVAFADAGADCLYAPGVREAADIIAMVRAVAPRPVNVLMAGPGMTVAELADLGVRRISVGGALARVAWGAVATAAEQIKAGSFDGLAGGLPRARLNSVFEASTEPHTPTPSR
jgi:2-methylisocitrate lyase-like PEP mutase family enzyme